MHKRTTNRLARTRVTADRGDIDLITLASLVAAERTRARGRPASPHVIAYFAACPAGSHPLKLGEECAEIQHEIKSSPYRDDFCFESRWAVTVDELFRHINELDPTVIHFSGHGGEAGLVLQDEQGLPDPVSPRALAILLGATARRTRVVLLSACSTLAHAEVLCDKLDCAIAMDGLVGDR